MSKPFRELAEEFNTTAKAYLSGEVGIDLLTTKYSVLISHKATEAEEKKRLVETLYDCGLKWLQKLAEPGNAVEHSTTVTMLTLFSRLTDDDSIQFIPKTAPSELTDVALDLLRRAEGRDGGSSSTKGYIVKMAGQTLAAADKVKAVQDQMIADVTTSRDITPSKKIELKPKDGLSL